MLHNLSLRSGLRIGAGIAGILVGLAIAACGPSNGFDSIDASASGYSARQVRQLWEEAIASIANSEDCPQYGGLKMEPLEGLVPVGRDPYSGMWEFADARTGLIAEQNHDTGKLILTEETGLIFVLLPGGKFWMGSQRRDPGSPNFDLRAQLDEQPVHEVTLSPFLISKFEMTQGQWVAITGVNTSYYWTGSEHLLEGVNLLHPIEGNSWNECIEAFEPLGLLLPTEAQWEYAARAGTDTIWTNGNVAADLVEIANLADANAKIDGGPKDWDYVDWIDEWVMHSPVGQLLPNAFGLHDMHGNLWEWCRDAFRPDFYAISAAEDPICEIENSPQRVRRGGGFNGSDRGTRCAKRQKREPDGDGRALGCRPVIELATL